MSRTRLRTTLVLFLVLALVAGGWWWQRQRGGGPAAGNPATAAGGAASAAPVTLELSPADVLTVKPVDLVRTLSVTGGLKAVNSAVVKAKVAGELQRLTVREGDTVKAGQVIGQIDPLDNQNRLRQAQESAAAAKAQLDIAERTLTNNQALVDQNFISKTALDTSIANANAARANLRAAEAAVGLARKALSDAVLVAPISGVVSLRAMQPGERAALDARVVEIVDLSKLEVEAAVSAEDVVELRVGQSAQLQVDGLGSPVTATVARINPSTQTGTRSVMAYLAVDPHPGLRQGLFASGRIDLARQTTLAVPTELVRIDQPQPYVLALNQGRVVSRPVVQGVRGEALFTPPGRLVSAVELKQGVAEGDVLLRGVVGAVRSGTPARLAASRPAP